MRRKDKEIKNLRDVENVLKEATVGRLGTCKDGEPYVVPICFVYNDGKILLHSVNEGKKIQHISQNPKVCFEVDLSEIILSDSPCDYSFRYKSVIVDGEARIVKRLEEKIDALIKITEKICFW